MNNSTGRHGFGAPRATLPGVTIGRAVAACLAGIAMALAIGSTNASPAGQIVVRGADAGSHLRLYVAGGNLVVDGYMARGPQAGCHRRDRNTVVCPLAGAGGVEVNMGPSNDKIEVLDPLPVPLTAYLGKGEDKLIGNDETDVCYPQGTRRNRCIGGAGDDVCISGPRNTDCVGQGGEDYCQTSTGSDGCWGGPGNDICVMGPGQDGCHGEQGNDRIYGGADPDQLYGGAGFDYCSGGPGVGKSHECEAGPQH